MACLFISFKITNCLKPIEFIIDNFCLFEKIENEEDKIKIKEKVLFYESDIFCTINFSMDYESPFLFLKKILGIGEQAILNMAIGQSEKNINNFLIKFDNNADKIKHIKENIVEIVNYSFLFPFFLYYDIEAIALSCLNLSFKKLNIQINITDIINIISTQKETKNVSIDIKTIEICSSLIDELVLSQIKKAPQNEQDNINNINIQSQNKQNFWVINPELNKETKEKTFLLKKRK